MSVTLPRWNLTLKRRSAFFCNFHSCETPSCVDLPRFLGYSLVLEVLHLFLLEFCALGRRFVIPVIVYYRSSVGPGEPPVS